MRLINAETLELHEFVSDPPPYAVLSHRWGTEEVGYKDFVKKRVTSGAGYKEILDCCSYALSRKLEWVWIDTCCIDKRSSSELSEAINSMFQWYGQAIECYAFLVDIDIEDCHGSPPAQALAKSDWFRRGWTLQELIAPAVVLFLDQQWNILGQKLPKIFRVVGYPKLELSSHVWSPSSIADGLEQITKIDRKILLSESSDLLGGVSIATKMTWMAGRRTTRIEDKAYCLFGLFGINLPLLYGEGGEAFERLQMELLRVSNDETIFSWHQKGALQSRSLLAPSPDGSELYLRHKLWNQVTRSRKFVRTPYVITNAGLQFTVHQRIGMYRFFDSDNKEVILITLNCEATQSHDRTCGFLTVKRISCGHYARVPTSSRQINQVIPKQDLEAIFGGSRESYTLTTTWRKANSPLGSVLTESQQPFNIYIHFGPRQHEACDCHMEVSELVNVRAETERRSFKHSSGDIRVECMVFVDRNNAGIQNG